MKANKEIVLTAIDQDVMALLYTSKDIKSDANLALNVVKYIGIALTFSGKDMESRRNVVEIAVKQSGEAIKYGSAAPSCKRYSSHGLSVSEGFKLDIYIIIIIKYASSTLQAYINTLLFLRPKDLMTHLHMRLRNRKQVKLLL
jgi:hypothetical protein